MNIDDRDKLLDHDYDGIKELDNPLPGWWLATFYITIVFAAGYYAYYTFLGGPNLDQELEAAMKDIRATQASNHPAPDSLSDAALLAIAKNPDALKVGAEKFRTVCAACHGPNGEGLIGPNLTDNYWIHTSGNLANMRGIIAKGVVEKGMPAWEAVLTPDEINDVAVYVRSLQGTKPANAKPPQGEEYEQTPP